MCQSWRSWTIFQHVSLNYCMAGWHSGAARSAALCRGAPWHLTGCKLVNAQWRLAQWISDFGGLVWLGVRTSWGWSFFVTKIRINWTPFCHAAYCTRLSRTALFRKRRRKQRTWEPKWELLLYPLVNLWLTFGYPLVNLLYPFVIFCQNDIVFCLGPKAGAQWQKVAAYPGSPLTPKSGTPAWARTAGRQFAASQMHSTLPVRFARVLLLLCTLFKHVESCL